MRYPHPMRLFSLLLLGCLSVVTSDARAAGKRPGARAGTPALAAGRNCRKAAPVVAQCAPNKVLFPPAVASPYPEGQIKALAAADLNGDGKTDLILSHGRGSVMVMFSKGEGEFEPGPKFEAKVGGEGLVVADLDGDCIPDVLVSSFGDRSVDESVEFHPGKGDGSFGPAVTTDIKQSNLATLLTADVNADGRPDFIYKGQSAMGTGNPTYVLNGGKGRFAGPGLPQDIQGSFTVGDVNGDGAAEFVSTVDTGSSAKMCVHANNGHGQFAAPECYPLSPSTRPVDVAIADLDGDGKNDIVVACTLMTSEGGTLFNVFLNLGEGKFDDRVPYNMPTAPYSMTAADVDNDGKPDLVVYKGHTDPLVALLKNKGDGTFMARAERYPIGGTSGYPKEPLVTGDFNGNGLIGFATIDRGHNTVSVIAARCKP